MAALRVLAVVVFLVVAFAMTTGVAFAAAGPVDDNPADFVVGLFYEAVLGVAVVFFIGVVILVFRHAKLVFRRR